MSELKHLFESLELRKVKTYIQSGNVLFESEMEEYMLRQQIDHDIHPSVDRLKKMPKE